MNKKGLLYLLLTVTSLLLTFESERERFIAQAANDELDGALANVVGRVREAERNLKEAAARADAACLAKARAWALLAEADTSCLTNQVRLKRVCRLLDTDEVCVTDEKGVLTASEPKDYCGFDLSSTVQSAAFMPAITNKAFELAQAPQPRGVNRDLFQYVGVARRDRPGIAQVGIGQKRIDQLRSLVSTEQIVRTSRVRRGGFVTIEPKDAPVDKDDRGLWIKRQVVGDWCVTVTGPILSDRGAAAIVSLFFGVLTVIFALLLLRAVIPDPRRITVAQGRACAFVCLGILSLFLVFESSRATAEAETVREKLLLSLENVTSRVRSAAENAKAITEQTKASNLAKKSAYDLLVKTDPSILGDTNRLAYARRAFDEEDVDRMQALAGFEEACRSVREPDGRFTDFVPFSASASGRPKGYFTERRDGRTCLCLAAKCEGRLVTVGVPTPERFLARPVVRTALLVLVALLFACALGALAPKAAVAVGACAKATFAYFWGLRAKKTGRLEERPRLSFWEKLTNPIVIACLAGFCLCFSGTVVLRMNEAWKTVKEGLLTVMEATVGDVSGSVDNMLFAVSRAVVRHYRRPDAFTQKDAEDLIHRYDVDEISIADARGILNVTTCGSIGFDMGAYPATQPFNELLRGKDALVQPFRTSEADASALRKFAGAAFPDAPGYVQVGIDQKRLLNELKYLFTDSVRNRSIGRRGFPLWVVDETGEIVANGAPEARPDDTLAKIGFNAATAPEAGVPFKADFYGRECLVVWKPYANLRLYAVLPCDEISDSVRVFWPCLMQTLVFGCFLLLALRLADLVSQLKSFILAEHERQKSDMTMARTIQTSALPVGFPRERDFRIFAKMTAAREVGGDFYDFYALPDGRIAFLVADVSGKGVPAALFMMRAKATVRSAIIENGGNLADAVRQANDSLSENNDAEMFVTAWVAVYDRKTGEVEYVSAGHNPPVVKRGDGSVEWVRARGGLALAAMGGVPYRSHRLRLAPGDSIFLYTDGVTEAIDTACEQYGEQRLEATIRRSGREFVSEISEDLAAFTAGADQFDDITMLAFDVLPTDV